VAALTATDIADLVAATLYDLGPLRFQQIAQSLPYYEVFSKWFKKDKVMFDSGIGIQRTLMSKLDSTSAKHVGLMDTDQVNIPRRAAALLGLVEELEDRAWGAAPGTTDKILPYSIQYWVVENATTGFNGGLPGSHPTIGGVGFTDSPNFKNYTAVYTSV